MSAAPSFPFCVITARTASRVIEADRPACVEIVRHAYLTHHEGQSVNPNSYFLRLPDNPRARIIALPAQLGGEFGVAGIKWIASYPANIERGFPRASAVLILNDGETGYPIACLEGSVISAARTAASALVAVEAIRGRRPIATLGIVGTGLIARYIYQFLLGTGHEIGAVRLHDLDPRQAERFREQSCAPPVSVSIDTDLGTLLRASDVIVFATVAPAPHVHDVGLLAHCPLVLHVSLRDLSPEILLASHNIVDDVNHVMNADTSPHLAEKRSGGRDFVNGTLAEVITGKVCLDEAKPIIFSPFGLGILDLAVGSWVLRHAQEASEEHRINDFFDLTR